MLQNETEIYIYTSFLASLQCYATKFKLSEKCFIVIGGTIVPFDALVLSRMCSRIDRTANNVISTFCVARFSTFNRSSRDRPGSFPENVRRSRFQKVDCPFNVWRSASFSFGLKIKTMTAWNAARSRANARRNVFGNRIWTRAMRAAKFNTHSTTVRQRQLTRASLHFSRFSWRNARRRRARRSRYEINHLLR